MEQTKKLARAGTHAGFEDRYPKLYDRWPMVVTAIGSGRSRLVQTGQILIGWTERDEIAVSGIGTIAAGSRMVAPRTASIATVHQHVSMYGRSDQWSHPSVKTGLALNGYADSSVHRTHLRPLGLHRPRRSADTSHPGRRRSQHRLHGYGRRRGPLLGGEQMDRSVFEMDDHHRALEFCWSAGTASGLGRRIRWRRGNPLTPARTSSLTTSPASLPPRRAEQPGSTTTTSSHPEASTKNLYWQLWAINGGLG